MFLKITNGYYDKLLKRNINAGEVFNCSEERANERLNAKVAEPLDITVIEAKEDKTEETEEKDKE